MAQVIIVVLEQLHNRLRWWRRLAAPLAGAAAGAAARQQRQALQGAPRGGVGVLRGAVVLAACRAGERGRRRGGWLPSVVLIRAQRYLYN